MTRLDPASALGYLETTGRVSGQPRETEIWFALDGDDLYLLSGGGLAKDWVRNLRANPRVRFRVGGVWATGTATVLAADDPRESRIRRVVAGKYYGLDVDSDDPLPNAWSRTAAPVVIALD